MCGITGGTNVAAAQKMARKLGKGKTIVTILPDTAERYFSTPLFDEQQDAGKNLFLQNRDICYIMDVTNERKG